MDTGTTAVYFCMIPFCTVGSVGKAKCNTLTFAIQKQAYIIHPAILATVTFGSVNINIEICIRGRRTIGKSITNISTTVGRGRRTTTVQINFFAIFSVGTIATSWLIKPINLTALTAATNIRTICIVCIRCAGVSGLAFAIVICISLRTHPFSTIYLTTSTTTKSYATRIT